MEKTARKGLKKRLHLQKRKKMLKAASMELCQALLSFSISHAWEIIQPRTYSLLLIKNMSQAETNPKIPSL